MTPEKKPWIVLGVVGVILAAGAGALIYFQKKHIEEDRAQAESLRQTIAQHRDLIKTTPDLIKKVIIQRETDAVIREILPDDDETNDLVRSLHQFAQDSGFVITSLKKQRDSAAKKNKQDFEKVGYALNFDADVFQLLSFLDKVESHSRLMNATSFKVTAANRSDYDEGAGPRHKVQVDVETYVYNSAVDAKEVKIEQYDRKRDLLVSEISKRAAELRVQRYDYRGPQGRRDPFIDPRVPANVDGGPMLTIEEQIKLVDDLVALVDEAKISFESVKAADNLIAEMKANSALEEQLAHIDEEIRRVEAANQLTFIPAERRFQKQVVEVVQAIRNDRDGQDQGQGPSLTALREANEAMRRHIDAQEYELALDVFDAVEPRLALAEREEHKRELAQSLRDLEVVAQTVIEFEKIELEIRGIAMLEDEHPVALINGQAVSEGEMIGDELVVRNIGPDHIEFSFRNLLLARAVEYGTRDEKH
jgi:Tfp pilus assembly protein PilO